MCLFASINLHPEGAYSGQGVYDHNQDAYTATRRSSGEAKPLRPNAFENLLSSRAERAPLPVQPQPAKPLGGRYVVRYDQNGNEISSSVHQKSEMTTRRNHTTRRVPIDSQHEQIEEQTRGPIMGSSDGPTRRMSNDEDTGDSFSEYERLKAELMVLEELNELKRQALADCEDRSIEHSARESLGNQTATSRPAVQHTTSSEYGRSLSNAQLVPTGRRQIARRAEPGWEMGGYGGEDARIKSNRLPETSLKPWDHLREPQSGPRAIRMNGRPNADTSPW